MSLPDAPNVTALRCLRCGSSVQATPRAYTCPQCGPGDRGGDPGVLDVRYDMAAAARLLERSRRGAHPLSRWSPLLPVAPATHLLVCGDTPLFAAPRLARRLRVGALLIKDETRNPTRCLKDRATAIALTMAGQLNADSTYCASAGNAAISLAAFAAHAGLPCHVFVPSDASAVRLEWLRRFGASVHMSDGGYDEAFDDAESFGRHSGSYSRNCAYNPFLVEGKKTVALEIGEQLNFRAPDMVVAPVGDGCTLGAIGKGFRELRDVGLARATPRLIGVQASGVSPVTARFRGMNPTLAGSGSTAAASIAVRRPRNVLRVLAEVQASGGAMLAVVDDAMYSAQALLSEEAGIVCELTSAATCAAVAQLAGQEDLSGSTVVLVITGGRPD